MTGKTLLSYISSLARCCFKCMASEMKILDITLTGQCFKRRTSRGAELGKSIYPEFKSMYFQRFYFNKRDTRQSVMLTIANISL